MDFRLSVYPAIYVQMCGRRVCFYCACVYIFSACVSLNGRIQSVYVSTFTSVFHVFALVPLCRQCFAVTVVYIFTCPCVCVFSQRKPVEGKLAIGERSE